MITSFDSKIFLFKNISKWFVCFLACILLSGNPVLVSNGIYLFPNVNLFETMQLLVWQTGGYIYFGLTVTCFFVSFFNALASECYSLNSVSFECGSINDICENQFSDFLILDFSNPFLHSSKTKGLRE